jgi:hypothetical protein
MRERQSAPARPMSARLVRLRAARGLRRSLPLVINGVALALELLFVYAS